LTLVVETQLAILSEIKSNLPIVKSKNRKKLLEMQDKILILLGK
jgi:hypothetical protein